MGDLVIAAVPITLIKLIFPMCVDHLQRAVDKAPNDISIETIEQRLLSGEIMLITVSDNDDVIAANIVEKEKYATGHAVLYVSIVGGDRMSEWMDRFLNICHALARDYKCDELRGMACRKGWLKALKNQGWYRLHEVVGCKVKDEETK